MLNQFSRTELLLGSDAMERLANARVAVFGIGGVGTYTADALARSGVGAIDLIDDDNICLTNINRQLIATRSTVGKLKVDVMKDRLLDINPNINVVVHKCFFDAEHADQFDFSQYSYIIDAIDTVSAKLALVECAQKVNVPIISCMGAGNKLDPTRFEVADIYKTSVCPLAKVMRSELRKRGIKHLKVVYSREQPLKPLEDSENSCKYNCVCPPGTKRKCTIRRQVPGSISFVPSVAGLILAGEVIKDIAQIKPVI
ncbi:MAG: tRNA threonylcarbamoyladenosine dehydratase [Oscillospiraceae bacterium]|nr:tRNA threonylcarbamoyladenosine dehydratase [Oscillospiraceae bacterium]